MYEVARVLITLIVLSAMGFKSWSCGAWRARGGVEKLVRPESLELFRLESAFVIAMETADFGTRLGNAVFVDGGADECVEFGHDSLGSVDDF